MNRSLSLWPISKRQFYFHPTNYQKAFFFVSELEVGRNEGSPEYIWSLAFSEGNLFKLCTQYLRPCTLSAVENTILPRILYGNLDFMAFLGMESL